MKRKTFSILLTLVLALSLCLVTAVPVAAQTIYNVIPFTLAGTGGNTSEWSTEQFNTGSHSVKLIHIGGASIRAYVQFTPPTGITLAEFVAAPATYGFSYWRTEDKIGPQLELTFTDGSDGWVELTAEVALYDYLTDDLTGQWIDKTLSATEQCQFFGDDSEDAAFNSTGLGDLSALITDIAAVATADDAAAVGAWEMTKVIVDCGWSGDTQTAYIDDIIIDGTTYYGHIGDTIAIATANDTVVVAAGTYTQDISIPAGKDNLELKPAIGAAVTIKGVTTTADGSWPLAEPNIDILSSGVKIHGFTIEGPDAVADKYASGLLIGAANVEIYDNTFKTCTQNTGHYSVVIQTYRKTSIAGVDLSGLNIHENTFDDLGDGTVGYDGIFVNIDAGTGTATISDNDFTGSLIRAIAVERSNVVISGNSIITDMTRGFPGGHQGIFIGCYELTVDGDDGPVQTNVSITGNTVKGATSSDGFTQGIRIGHSSDQIGFSGITVSGNTVEGNVTGVIVRARADATPVAVVINYNSIVGNTTKGVDNATVDAVLIDAENNYWGDISGPSTVGTGSGDAVSADVDYIPWLDAEYPGGASTYPAEINGVGYDTIQEAVTAALTDDVLTIAPGEYTLDITINEDITLVSSGGSEVTKITGTGGTDPVITIGDYTVTLEGFEIDPGDEGVYIYDISAGNVVTIEDSVIHSNTYKGIWVEGTVYGTLNILNNIIAENGTQGILINEVDDGGTVVIQGNVVGAWEDADYTSPDDLSGNLEEGIFLDKIYDGSTVTIGGDEAAEANIICDNGYEGIYVNELYYGCTLTIEGNTIGAYHYDGYTFDGNDRYGVYIDYVDYGCTVTIKDNDITENAYEGIEIYEVGFDDSSFTADEYYALYQTYGANYVTIEGNTITDNYEDGLYISYADFATYITIEDNVVSRNVEEGIELEHFGQNGYDYYLNDDTASVHQDPDYPDYFGPVVLVKGNTITDNEYDGIYQYDDWEFGTSVTIEDNVITGNWYAGIYHDYDVMNDAHVLIRGNTIASNGFVYGDGGIFWCSDDYICYASSYTVENNLIAGNWDDGIYIYEVCDDSSLTIRGNTIGAGTDAQGSQYPANDGYGIYIDYVDYNSTAEISRNTISGNSDDGIDIDYVYEYSSVNITRNIITENSDGIDIGDVYDDGSVSITRNDILDNDSYGIYIYDVYESSTAGSLEAHYNNIAGNSSDGVYNSYVSADEYVDASNNWWGDASGPYHSSYNPDGLGDEVSDYVYFSPWLTSPGVRVALAEGWNTFATPIALDTASNELAKLGLDMNIAYGFSGGVWTQIIPANDDLEPCEAFYIKMNSRDIFDLTPSDTYSDPPSRALSAGWNLVSLANLSDMAAEDGLASAYLVSGDYTGYSQVVSPAVNQAAWSAVRGPAMDTALGYDLLPCEGYWVFMNNAGTLAGFTSTPVLGP